MHQVVPAMHDPYEVAIAVQSDIKFQFCIALVKQKADKRRQYCTPCDYIADALV